MELRKLNDWSGYFGSSRLVLPFKGDESDEEDYDADADGYTEDDHHGGTCERQEGNGIGGFFFFFVCFTSYFVFSIAVLPHSPGVVYYHLLLRPETRIPGVAPFSFRIGIWDLFVHRGQKSYTPTAFGKLWTTPGVRCMKHASS